ncbi:MAG: hypothetical protein ACRCWM_04205 [Sarcina sp.]
MVVKSKSIPIYLLGLGIILTPFFARYSNRKNILKINNNSDMTIESLKLVNEDGKSLKEIDYLIEKTSCELNLSVYHASDELKLIYTYNDNQNIQSFTLKKSKKELTRLNEITIDDVTDIGALTVTTE